jgi:peptidoglycan/LPS O-acetylase OafA/YrhL
MEKAEIKMEKSPSRKYYYDYWRAFMVISVLIHHSYLSYVIGYDWYVNDLVKTLEFTRLSIILDVFMMPIMFFIAGYFAFPSIKNGVKRFILKKVIRIAIPFAIGVLFLAPIMLYLYVISHFPLWEIDFFDFWLNYYFTDTFMDPSHYWFLSLLFFFFMVFGAVYAVTKRRLLNIYEKSEEKPNRKIRIIVIIMAFLLISIVLFYIAGFVYPDGSWYYFLDIKFLKLQITRSILYLLYFIMGIFVFIKRIKLPKKFLKFTPLLIVLSIIATIAFCFFKFDIVLPVYLNWGFLPPDYQLYNAIVHILYCFLIFITLMAFFQTYLNRQSKLLSRIAANSYKIYLVHLIWVVIIQYLLLEIQIFVFFKFLITVIGAFGLSLLTGELLRLIKRGFVGILKLKK